MKRSPLKRKTGLTRKTPLQPVSRERARRWARCKRVVRARSGGQCEAILAYDQGDGQPLLNKRCENGKPLHGAHYPYDRKACGEAWDDPDFVMDACYRCHWTLDGKPVDLKWPLVTIVAPLPQFERARAAMRRLKEVAD